MLVGEFGTPWRRPTADHHQGGAEVMPLVVGPGRIAVDVVDGFRDRYDRMIGNKLSGLMGNT